MDDLISRAAALDVLVTSPNFHTTLTRIEELPAVDAAPMVRCRDCINYDNEPFGDVVMCYRGLGWTDDDDYCSFGERRESE